jgi:phosphoglycerate kinase
MRSIQDINFKSKKALIRVDFNVPLDAGFNVADDTRIRAAKPTIMKVLEDGGSCILMSHLGRPTFNDPQFSLRHIVNKLQDILGVSVLFSTDCVGEKADQLAKELEPGQVLLLENLRYHKAETSGDLKFAEKLSKLADFYINDAFGTAHRAHASTTIVAQFFSNAKCFGFLLAKEIESIEKVMSSGKKPVLAILGGAKVSSKITIIENILDKIDHLIIGGGMSFTFVKAQGGHIGDSICEDDKQALALEILKIAAEKNVKVHLPVDVLAADDFNNTANTQIVDIHAIPSNWQGLDCGPKSKAIFHQVVQECQTILWNGPLGVFEMETFSTGTIALGDAIVEATKNGAFSLVGGGDSVAAVKQFGFDTKVSYVSTGGGAMLESLEGKTLPGIAAMQNH